MDGGDNLWIGTFSRGVDVYNTKTKVLSNYRNRSDNKNTLNDDCVFSLYKTRGGGDIYAGTPAGLNKYNKNTDNFIPVESIEGFIYDIKEDNSGNLWLASYGTGVIKFDIKTNKWICYDDILSKDNPVVGSKLTSVHIDSQRRILFSSEGRGIFIYDALKDDFTNISESNGLPNNVVYGILDDPFGNLWISCNKGLVCFNLSTPTHSTLYNKEDGLQSNQFNYKSSYKAKNGRFYFGGINGFSSFYPQDLNASKNIVIPPVEITGIKLFDNSDTELENEIQIKVNKRQKIKLPYNKASFMISYVSLSYIAQTKNQYAYKLEGADTDWNYVENNKNVTYVNLPYGKYIFKVKATNNDGLWNEAGSEIEIEILPPFWLSLPAKILYFILLMSLAYLILSYYWKKNKEKQAQQLEAFKTEQETLAFKSKIDFFTTIAHEVRTPPLSLISAPLEEVINTNKENGETKQNLQIIEKNCNRLTVLINQLLDFRKMDSTRYIINPESINLKDFIFELYERFKKTAQRKEINFTLDLPKNEEIKINSDADALIKIIGNLLTNALKYTKDKIKLTLICNSDNSYTITVEDNGKGISDNHKKLIFDPFFQVQTDDRKIGTGLGGLSLAKNLAEVLGGSISVKDGENGGSVFIFKFADVEPPIQNEAEKESTLPASIEVIKQHDSSVQYSILIVEDNPDMVSFITRALQNEYITDASQNAMEALMKLEEKNYDIVISDIMMPGIDGISFAKKLKLDINYSHIPIILLSAKTENAVKVEGLLSGADVFIEKPFSVSYLKAQIISLLENRKAMLDTFNRSPMTSYSNLVSNKSDEIFLNKLNEEIEQYVSDENFSVESLTERLNISRSNLQRKLKSISGLTPGDYLRSYRIRKACKLLLETDMRINEVAYSVGFSSPSYFAKVFQKSYNMSPKEFINKYMKDDKKES